MFMECRKFIGNSVVFAFPVKLAGTPVLRTGREVRNLAYRISETIEPKNQKVGRNMEI